MPISSQALGESKEGSETRDTTVSPQRPTPRTGDDIVQSCRKLQRQKVFDKGSSLFEKFIRVLSVTWSESDCFDLTNNPENATPLSSTKSRSYKPDSSGAVAT